VWRGRYWIAILSGERHDQAELIGRAADDGLSGCAANYQAAPKLCTILKFRPAKA
jgi:hypothetical protein